MKMFRKIVLTTFVLSFFFVEAQKVPEQNKEVFPVEALNQSIKNQEGKDVTIQSILDQYKGNVVVLDIWATWCKDCLIGFPALEELQAKNPDVKFVYFSLDKNQDAWKKGIEKYQLVGDHYWFDQGWKNDFNNQIDLNWIPRYLVLDKEGKIAKYYAVKADDPAVQETLELLKK